MRNLFGPMVDSPSPREYIDSQTETRVIDTVVNAMKTGIKITFIWYYLLFSIHINLYIWFICTFMYL
jgi:hypothetical protein